ncbi:MAG: ABC transporter substrate-binding protein [Defluviitaleaceae bacterium]|nr:ABC transporter substrate-binding protein [Defluviitaleaceae bacterium]
MNRRFMLFVLTMLVALVTFVACGRNQDDAPEAQTTPVATQPGGQDVVQQPEVPAEGTTRTHITVAMPGSPVQLDHTSNDSPSAQVSRHIFDTLFDMCYDTFEIFPALGVTWRQPNASVTYIDLRQDVYFTDGSKLNAEAVAFSINRVRGIGPADAIVGMISGAYVVSEYTVRVETYMDFAPILSHLAHPIAGIISMEHYLSFGDDPDARRDGFRADPIGSGMFTFVEWRADDRIELERNDDWWGDELPLIETITFRIITDSATRFLELRTGGVDVVLGVAAADLGEAEADPAMVLRRRITFGNDYIGFNASNPQFADYRVRQAISYALDVPSIVNAAWMGLGVPAQGFFNAIVPGFAATQPFPNNLDRARELLAEAGFADGFDTEIWWNIGNPMRNAVADMVAHDLAMIGINVTVHAMEWPIILERTEQGDSYMFIMGWSTVTADADYALFPLFHSSMHGPSNRTFFSNDRVDELLDQGRSVTDPATRNEIYYEAQQILRDLAPWVPLRQGEEAVAVSPALRGFEQNPSGHHNYGRVWFED